MKIYASFKDMYAEKSSTELLLLTHYSPSQHHLKVWTSTKDAKVLKIIFIWGFFSFFMSKCMTILHQFYTIKLTKFVIYRSDNL